MEKHTNNFSDFFNKYKHIFDDSLVKKQTSYKTECNTEVSIYSDNAISFDSQCIKCMKYLEYLDEDFRKEEVQKQGIIYLYFWLYYYELQNDIFKGKTLDNFKKLMHAYGEIRQTNANIHNMYSNHIESILNYDLNDLFYIYEKFDNFQKQKECTPNKCRCAQECIATFKNSVEKCNVHGNKYFCNELENFRNQYNEYRLTETDCPEVDLYLPPFKKYSTSVIILISFITLSVLSSLLFILYKFTPFGSCVGFRSKRSQRMYSNFINEEANLLYTKGRSKASEAKPYNIAYNSI